MPRASNLLYNFSATLVPRPALGEHCILKYGMESAAEARFANGAPQRVGSAPGNHNRLNAFNMSNTISERENIRDAVACIQAPRHRRTPAQPYGPHWSAWPGKTGSFGKSVVAVCDYEKKFFGAIIRCALGERASAFCSFLPSPIKRHPG